MAGDLAGRIREAREKLGMSARALSDAAELADGHVSLIESGQRPTPSGEVLLKLGRVLGVSVEWLLTGEESGPSLPNAKHVRAKRAAGS